MRKIWKDRVGSSERKRSNNRAIAHHATASSATVTSTPTSAIAPATAHQPARSQHSVGSDPAIARSNSAFSAASMSTTTSASASASTPIPSAANVTYFHSSPPSSLLPPMSVSSVQSVDSPDIDLNDLVTAFRAHVPIRDRRYHLSIHRNVFVGSEAIDWMVAAGIANTRPDAIAIGLYMQDAGLVEHCTRDHAFKDAQLFYRFVADHPRAALRVPREARLQPTPKLTPIPRLPPVQQKQQQPTQQIDKSDERKRTSSTTTSSSAPNSTSGRRRRTTSEEGMSHGRDPRKSTSSSRSGPTTAVPMAMPMPISKPMPVPISSSSSSSPALTSGAGFIPLPPTALFFAANSLNASATANSDVSHSRCHCPHDARLLATTCPPNRRAFSPPNPPPFYDLVVIGAGSAGIAAADLTARAGARVAIVEKHALGGASLLGTTVPATALRHAARLYHTVTNDRLLANHGFGILDNDDDDDEREHYGESAGIERNEDSRKETTREDYYYGSQHYRPSHEQYRRTSKVTASSSNSIPYNSHYDDSNSEGALDDSHRYHDAGTSENNRGGDISICSCWSNETDRKHQNIMLNTAQTLRYVRKTRAEAAVAQGADVHVLRELGMHIYFGHAKFTSASSISIAGGPILSFRKAIIATGSQPMAHRIDGLGALLSSKSNAGFARQYSDTGMKGRGGEKEHTTERQTRRRQRQANEHQKQQKYSNNQQFSMIEEQEERQKDLYDEYDAYSYDGTEGGDGDDYHDDIQDSWFRPKCCSQVPVLTGESLVGLVRLPRRVAVFGVDRHSLSIAQSLCRLGVTVTVLCLKRRSSSRSRHSKAQRSGHSDHEKPQEPDGAGSRQKERLERKEQDEELENVLRGEDRDAARAVRDSLVRDGVIFRLSVEQFVNIRRVDVSQDHQEQRATLKSREQERGRGRRVRAEEQAQEEDARCVQGAAIVDCSSEVRVTTVEGGRQRVYAVDAVFMGGKRRAAVHDAGLEVGGVQLSAAGRIVVSASLQTTNPRVFAAGSAVGYSGAAEEDELIGGVVGLADPHTGVGKGSLEDAGVDDAADAEGGHGGSRAAMMGRIAARNAVLQVSSAGVGVAIGAIGVFPVAEAAPRARAVATALTEPEVARVGATARALRARGVGFRAVEVPLGRVARSVLERGGGGGRDDGGGFVRLLVATDPSIASAATEAAAGAGTAGGGGADAAVLGGTKKKKRDKDKDKSGGAGAECASGDAAAVDPGACSKGGGCVAGAVLGGTVVARNNGFGTSSAAELAAELAVAVQTRGGIGGLRGLGTVMRPFPTIGGAVALAADEHNARRLTPAVLSVMRKAWQSQN